MVDKPAHSASAAHTSAVKAMGFADWFLQRVIKREFVQELSAGICLKVCECTYACEWNSVYQLITNAFQPLSSHKKGLWWFWKQMVWNIVSGSLSAFCASPWTIYWPLSFNTQPTSLQVFSSLRHKSCLVHKLFSTSVLLFNSSKWSHTKGSRWKCNILWKLLRPIQ